MVKELVSFLVQQLVSHPQDVIIDTISHDDVDVIEIKVAPEDRGRVIGKEGHTIKALRVLVELSSLQEKKVVLELSR